MNSHPSTVVAVPCRARAGGCRTGARPGADRPRRTPGSRSRSARWRPKAPRGTTSLQEIGAGWKKASGGQIAFTIFGGGVQGDEADMIRKMRGGQLQMGAFTTVGLETISKEMSALWIPLLFQNYDELDYVRGKLDAAPGEGAGRQGLRRPQLG